VDIPAQRHTFRDTSSDSTRRLAETLADCYLTHNECKYPQIPYLPKRTVFAGSNNSQIFLSENERAQRNRDACLSHCWGGIQPLRTTSKSIAEHKRGIPWHHLPKTFQGAIVFCQELGIGHIWIDSLCFLQDDDNDWAAESAMMASVYSGAVFTIAAMASKDRSGGCFRTDDRKPLEFSLADSRSGQTKVFVTPGSHERQIQRTHFPPKPEPETESPLRHRGWVLQEILQSRRIIYFQKYEIAWECRRASRCECRVENTLQLRGATLITRGRQFSAITPDARSRIAETNCRRYPE
jgi:hypothetical protein